MISLWIIVDSIFQIDLALICIIPYKGSRTGGCVYERTIASVGEKS